MKPYQSPDDAERPRAWKRKPPKPVSTTALDVIDLWHQDTTPDAPTAHQGPVNGATIAEAFLAFHNANPDVYAELVALARKARQRGATKLGIGMLFEVVRWRRILRTEDWGQAPFKLNNNYRALYARRIMERESDLAGIFETRELHAVTPWDDREAPDD